MRSRARVVVLPEQDPQLRVVELELPPPRPHEVVIRQFATGICHTQLSQLHRARDSALLLGHESTGVVIEVGSAVRRVAVGDRVLVTWVPRRPVDGRALCRPELELPNGTVAASRTVFTWADHTIADEAYVVHLPEDLPTDVTSVVGCAVLTGAGAVLRTARVGAGESVAIFGVGGVGLSAVAAAAVVGADPVIAVDLDPDKLALARRFGATHVVNAAEADAVAAIQELTGGGAGAGVEFAFDCIGAKQTMAQILAATRPGVLGERRGGTGVLVGIPHSAFEVDARALVSAERGYLGSAGGSCQPDRDVPIFLSWYRSGKLDLAGLVTQRFDLTEVNEATAALAAGRITGRAIIEFRG